MLVHNIITLSYFFIKIQIYILLSMIIYSGDDATLIRAFFTLSIADRGKRSFMNLPSKRFIFFCIPIFHEHIVIEYLQRINNTVIRKSLANLIQAYGSQYLSCNGICHFVRKLKINVNKKNYFLHSQNLSPLH